MDTILKEIEYWASDNIEIEKMVKYLNYVIKGFDAVIFKRPGKGIIVVPTELFIYFQGLEIYNNLSHKKRKIKIEKNIFTYWPHKDYIRLDVRPEFRDNDNSKEERDKCNFYSLEQLKNNKIDEKIIRNYNQLKNKIIVK